MASCPLKSDFKILLLLYKSLNGLGAKYISDLLAFYEPSRHFQLELNMEKLLPVFTDHTSGANSQITAA